MTDEELSRRISSGDSDLVRREGTPIVDEGGRLAGIITRSDLMRAMETRAGSSAISAGPE